MSYRITPAVLVLLLCTFVGCQTSAPPQAAKTGPAGYPYEIITTCGMVNDIVAEVAGDKAKVTALMGKGVDPHMYKPTSSDVSTLLKADVVFYSGLMLEGRMADTFLSISRQGKPVYPVTEKLEASALREPPEFEGHTDPHVWMDVTLWSQCAQHVSEVLGKYDPDNAAYYADRAKSYCGELEKLNVYAEEKIATIPEPQRSLITAHDAFGYFAEAYGIGVRSVQGITTESAAGVEDINRLVDFIVERKIGAIFVEDSVSEKSIQAVIEGVKQKGGEVRIGGTLFSDSMGSEGTYEGTYIGMMDHNVTVITRALGGDAPEAGLNGKLSGGEGHEEPEKVAEQPAS